MKKGLREECLLAVFLRKLHGVTLGVTLTLSKHFVTRRVLAYTHPMHYRRDLCFPGVGGLFESCAEDGRVA